jgi:hypothetical protein
MPPRRVNRSKSTSEVCTTVLEHIFIDTNRLNIYVISSKFTLRGSELDPCPAADRVNQQIMLLPRMTNGYTSFLINKICRLQCYLMESYRYWSTIPAQLPILNIHQEALHMLLHKIRLPPSMDYFPIKWSHICFYQVLLIIIVEINMHGLDFPPL